MRYPAAILAPLLLLLGACAPFPAQEPPPEPSAPPEPSLEGGSEPEPSAGERAESSDEPSDDAERARAVDPSRDKEPSTAQSSDEEVSEPAPTTAESDEPAAAAAEDARPETAPAETPRAPDAEKNLSVSGRIVLTGGDADLEEAVVYFVPEDGGSPDTVGDPGAQTIVTRDKSLSPTVLAVPRGSEIRFPNEDPILHNLFSVSSGNDFDLGVYGPGEAPSVKLEQTGVVNIYCNVHHDMHAHVLVVDTPYRTRPDAEGHFTLTGLPAGGGQLHVWHRQSNPWSRALRLPANGEIELTLEVTKPRLPPHRDKTGQSYNRRDRDPYR